MIFFQNLGNTLTSEWLMLEICNMDKSLSKYVQHEIHNLKLHDLFRIYGFVMRGAVRVGYYNVAEISQIGSFTTGATLGIFC